MRYLFLQHKLSNETWAARVNDAGRVVGVNGPLAAGAVSDSLLPMYSYRGDAAMIADFNAHPEDFRWGLVPDAAEPG